MKNELVTKTEHANLHGPPASPELC